MKNTDTAAPAAKPRSKSDAWLQEHFIGVLVTIATGMVAMGALFYLAYCR